MLVRTLGVAADHDIAEILEGIEHIAVTADEHAKSLAGNFDADILFIGLAVFAESFVDTDNLGFGIDAHIRDNGI